MRVTILCLLLVAHPAAMGAEPPSEWKTVLRENAQTVWDGCFEQERFYPTRLIAIFRQLGSQHDGDHQYEVARLLAQVEHDPREGLLRYLRCPDPYDRAFAVQVVAHLGDRRFVARLKELSSDTADVSRWDTLPYKDVGEAARRAIESLKRGRDDLSLQTPTPKWLVSARQGSCTE